MSYNESLRVDSNYPPMSQSDYDRAPWNEEENPEEEIDVTISMTLSKTVKIKVTDYKKGGEDIDFSESDLKKAVREQIYLPYEIEYLLMCLEKIQSTKEDKIREDLSNWNIDDLEVVLG